VCSILPSREIDIFCRRRATSFLRAARNSDVVVQSASNADSYQANGEPATPCLEGRVSRVRVPSPAPPYRPSLCRPIRSRPVATGQRYGKQGGGFSMDKKRTATSCLDFARHPAFASSRSAGTCPAVTCQPSADRANKMVRCHLLILSVSLLLLTRRASSDSRLSSTPVPQTRSMRSTRDGSPHRLRSARECGRRSISCFSITSSAFR